MQAARGAAARRLGYPRTHFRADSEISLYGRSRLHAAGSAGGKISRTARSSRFRAWFGGARQCARVATIVLARFPKRLRGVAITDARIAPATLREWHKLGLRGLRFHLFSSAGKPGYVRGVGLDVFERFRPVMRDLGPVMQVWCDWRLMSVVATTLREISREMPVVVDHMLSIPADRGVNDPSFQSLLRLVGEGHAYAKLSGAYRLSEKFPNYPDARAFHDALLAANPERLVWGTDWPHPQIDQAIMPDEGHLVDLFTQWTPDARQREMIFVETPRRLFDG